MIPSSNYQLSLSTPLQYGTIENLTDGDTDQYGYLPNGTSTLTIDLNQTTNVKGIRIGMYILTGFEYYTEKHLFVQAGFLLILILMMSFYMKK